MSVTKHQNEDGNLISQADVNSVRLSDKSSRCSCPDCDSADCFTKRNKELCHCGECKDPAKCFPLSNRKSQENKADLKDTATKKIIREVVTRETIESLKKVTETLYGFDSENLEMITERLSKLSNKKLKPNGKTSEVGKKSVCEKKEDKKPETKECCKPIKSPSKDVNQAQKEVDNTATKLSAQVMNVPYEEIHETVPSEHASEHIALSKLNIFKRIKEIYEACSCKVCECISTKPVTVPDEICKCKPCDCHDCASLRRKIDQTLKKAPHSGCPCIRCDRKDCRGIVKNPSEPQVCDCKPCDCIQCTENTPKPCNCEPCQCINCKSLNVRPPKTVKLAPMDDITQREICKCSPCECIECKQIYNRTNPTIMCTTSTEMTRYRHCRCENCPTERCQFGETETCTCQRHRSMRKSFERNYNDYDIRTVIVDTNSPFNQQKHSAFKKQSTVALFASLENNYPYNLSNNNICKCTDCECIVCPSRDETLRKRDTRLQPNVQLIQNSVNLNSSYTNACTCTSCECEICTKKERERSISIHSKCKCDICDCLNCDNASYPTCSTGIRKIAKPIKNVNKNNNCTCNPCECSNCRKLLSCTSQNSVKFYTDKTGVERKTARSLRKVMLISPTMSEFDHFQTPHASVSSTTLSPTKSMEGIFKQDIATCHYIPRTDYASDSRSLNTEQENSGNNNIISNNGFKKNDLLNFNKHPIESTSQFNRESKQNNHIVDTYNNLHQMTLKSLRLYRDSEDILYEPKYNDLSIIPETPVKISPNDSDELLPVFFTYHNEPLYSNNLHGNYKTPSTRPIDDVTIIPQSKRGVASCSHVGNVNKILDERTEQRKDQTIRDIKQTFGNDYHVGSLKGACYDKNYGNIFNNKHEIPQESYKYIDPFSIKDNKKKNERSTIDNNSDLTMCYEKASKVLQEAKAFSLKLVKMLDSFDKANREFKSESQKFKTLHKSLLNINNEEFNRSYNLSLKKPVRPYEGRTIHEFDDENKAEKEYEQFTRKTMDVTNSKYTQDLQPLSNDIFRMKYSNEAIIQTDNINEGHSKYTEYSIPQEPSIQNHEHKSFHKSADILLKKSRTSHRLVSNYKNLETNYSNQTQSVRKTENVNVTHEHTQRMALVMRKLDSVFGNTNDDLAVKTDDTAKKSEDHYEEGEKQPWTLFRKNLFLNSVPAVRNRRLFGSPTMESDIKEAIQAIKLQTAKYNPPKVVSRASEALSNLQSEVNSLLNMPILQSKEKAKVTDAVHKSGTKGETDSEVKSISTVSPQTYDRNVAKVDKQVYFSSDQIDQIQESSCDAYKAKFVGLRRISDHTVLVKWSGPKCLKDIEGYELLVDGRSCCRCGVGRRAAVLTCLPPATRVLLSVRAIGPASFPAHTVLYRPRR